MFNRPTPRQVSSFLAEKTAHVETPRESVSPYSLEMRALSYAAADAGPPASQPRPVDKRVIPPEANIRRLIQECNVGRSNALLLNQSLFFARPQEVIEVRLSAGSPHLCADCSALLGSL
jgi:hypothetical protein